MRRSQEILNSRILILMRRLALAFFCLIGIATTSAAETHVVKMLDTPPYLQPASLEIRVGDTVTWKNSGPKMEHVIIDDDLKLFSDDIKIDNEWSFTFKKAGVYPYVCFRHHFMRGQVIVRNPDGSLEAPLEYPYQAAFKEFVIPTLQAVPRMVIASKKDDSIWFTEGGGDFYGFENMPAQNKIGRLDDTGRMIEYATPTVGSDGSKVGVDSLVMDSKGNVWFTERLTNRIGKLDPKGTMQEFQIPTKNGYALGIDLDSKGNIWFAERYGNKIGWMTDKGEITEIELPEKDSEPRTVFVDSKDRIWYTARVANEIGYYDTASKKIERLQIPTKMAKPTGICQTSDGAIYFIEMQGNKIAKVVNTQIIEYPVPTKFSAPFKCAVDAHDNLWFTQVFGNSIAKFDTKTEQITEYKIPTADSRPGGITVDRKGRVWFTEQTGNKIGMFDPSKAAIRQQELPEPVVKEGKAGGFYSVIQFIPPGMFLPTEGESITTDHDSHKPISPEQSGGAKTIDDFNVPTTGGGPGNNLIEDEEGWLWFTEMYGNKVGAFNIRSQKFREFNLPSPFSMPVGLARDQRGKFWITQFRSNKLAQLDPGSGKVEEYSIPTDAALPAGVTVDENGDVWFAQMSGNKIARFGVDKKFEEYELPTEESGPLQIVSDRKGALWVSAAEDKANYLARFDLRTRSFKTFRLPTANASPVGLLVDGNFIWVAEGGAGKLARFDTAKLSWEEFAIPAEKSEPVKLAKDKAGRIWLTDGGGLGSSGGNRVAVFDPATKKFTLFAMKTQGAKPMGIIAASDGAIWFTQQGANRISRVSLEGDNGNF